MLGAGGLKFPTALFDEGGLAAVSRDHTLKGDGTPASRLGLSVPLQLSSNASPGEVLTVSTGYPNGHAIRVYGGPDPTA